MRDAPPTMRRIPLATLAPLALAAARPAAAPPALRDPFAGVAEGTDRCVVMDGCRRVPPLARRALLASDLSTKGFPARHVTRTIGGARFVVVQGWTGEGTGYGETSVLLFRAVGADSVRLAFRGVVAAHRTPWRPAEADVGFRVRGCVLLWGADGVAYFHRATGPGRAAADAELSHRPPANGYYRWSPAAAAFVPVRAADGALRRACATQRTLME